MRIRPAVAALLLFTASAPPQGSAPAGQERPCNDYLPAARTAAGMKVGPETCLMLESVVTHEGRTWVRVDLGIDGTADGMVTRDGPYHEYLTNGPDLVFEQAGTPGDRHVAVARYERSRGTAILLVHPRDPADWNGKLWVTAHGRGRSFRNGALKVWNRYYDPEAPLAAFDKIDMLMLEKGYALAVTKRTSEQGIGEIIATLDDGTVVDWAAFNDNATIIMDFAAVARTAIEKRLGRAPSRTYLYGHSAGARIGRSLNYTTGLNAGSGGRPVFDGFLLDDSATGLWLPIVLKDGRDVLFADAASRTAFRPQIEIVHQLYNARWDRAPDRPSWVSDSYLANKRLNARILEEKGLGPKFRMFEIRQMSHNGGEALPPDNRSGRIHVLDVSLVMDGAIDMLDALVEGGPPPVASRSDWYGIGDRDNDGVIENPALAYPEVACPLGVFYPWPQDGAGTTAFAAFTGEDLEPRDEEGVFVDMNRNGAWDFRETPTAAWRRLGLLGEREDLTRSRYVECIAGAARRLGTDGFFSAATVSRYIEQARTRDLVTGDGP